MSRWLSYLVALVLFLACGLGTAAAQKQPRPGKVIVPPSNAVPQQYRGRRAHTNFLIFVPSARSKKRPGLISGPSGETPSSLACIYQTGPTPLKGCPISYTNNYDNPSGGSQVIAIVDAYDYPSASTDFQAFSQQFGLPDGNKCGASGNAPCFQKTWPTTISQPQSNCSWAQEESLDIEWSHAMAPHAQIILVEAASNSNADLMTAVQYAAKLVANAGGGEVSMSWGGSEFSTQSTYDTYFTGKGVSFFASSGDTGGKVIWPSTSPDVISAGGTSIIRNSSGDFTGEQVWSSAGGGPSKLEPVPNYQSSINALATLLNGHRGTPDISFDADPYSGVSVYDTTSCQGLSGWLVFGGTSVASPSLAGIFNLAGAFGGGWDSGTNSSNVQSELYQNYSTASNADTLSPYLNNFFDVTQGSAGSYSAGNDWDYASGIGTLRGVAGITGSTSSVTVSSVSLSSSSVTGGNQLTGNTVTLSGPAPSGGATISFTSSDPTVVPAPADVTVSANNTSTTFTVSTNSVTSSTSVTITASYNNTSASATLTVNPATSSVTVSSVSLSSSSVTGGNQLTGNTVTLSGPAPSGGATISFTSSDPTVVPAPADVTVSANNTSTTFTVSTNSVTSSTSVTITASYNNTSASATLTVNPAATTGSFSLSASPGNVTLHGGGTAAYSISVTPSGGFDQTVSFAVSSSPALPQGTTVSSIPSVTGSGTTTLTVDVPSGSKGNYTLTITGSASGVPSQSVSVGLKIR